MAASITSPGRKKLRMPRAYCSFSAQRYTTVSYTHLSPSCSPTSRKCEKTSPASWVWRWTASTSRPPPPVYYTHLIEQVGQVFISLPLAYLGYQRSIAYGAAGALLGITLVEAVALLYMVLLYLRRRDALRQLPQEPDAELLSGRTLGSRLVRISIPITISCLLYTSRCV